MAEILRVPVTAPESRSNPNRSKWYAGGFDTAFIELPYYYILGGYMYSKSNLAPVTNGFCGLMYDHKVANYTDWVAHKRVENEGIVHANLLSYWGGPYMGFRMAGGVSSAYNNVDSLQNNYRNPCLWNQGGGMGTISRKPRPTASIRDSEDPNIIYYVMTGPDYGFGATVSKFDMTTKQTIWRQQIKKVNESEDIRPAYTDVSISNDILTVVSKDLDYLYQDKYSIYILGYGPKTSNNGYDPTSVYIFAVNKEDGVVSESNRFNLFTLGVFDELTENPSYISYRFLGFVSQTVFLLDVQQGVLSTRNGVTLNPSRNSRIGRVLLSYDVSDDSIRILWQAPLIDAPVPMDSSYSMIHDCYGPLICDALNNSVFIPYSSGIMQGYNMENVYQLHLNEAKDSVLSFEKLPYYSGQGKRVILLPTQGFTYVNYINTYQKAWMHSYNPKVFYWGSKDNIVGDDTDVPAWPGYTPSNNKWSELGYYDDVGFASYMPKSASNNTTYHRPSRVSYEYMHTTRNEPVLRILGCIPVTSTRKTILPCGEDIIGAGYEACHYNVTEGVSAAFLYTDPSGVAHPWGVIVEHSPEWVRHSPTNGAYAGDAMGNCFGITQAPQGFPYMYIDTNNGDARSNALSYIPSARIGSIGYIADFANGNPSYTLRRSAPDLVDCCIYLNNQPMPIHAVSYSLNPNPYYIDYAPTSWYVEALDVETNTWIEVDRQTNVALSFPPNITTDYSRLAMDRNYNFGITELRQYRTYFVLEDMDTKCPQGAHAFRITFTDSADNTHVSISQFMIQEKPWPWQPAMAAEYLTARPRNTLPVISDTAQIAVSCNPTSQAAIAVLSATARSHEGMIPSLAHAIYNWDSARMGHIPINMSVIGPRTAVFMHGPYHSNYNYSGLQPYFGEGVFIYAGSNNYLPAGTFLKYEFAEPLEIQGIQLTIMGNRDNIYGQPVSSKTGVALRYASNTYGCDNSDDMVIQGSNDNENWDDLAQINNADLLPGLPNTYVANIPVWSKTFLFELDNPVAYKFYRVYWNNKAMTIAAGVNAGRAWVVNSFSFFKKRDPSYADKVIPTQSVVGTYINYNNKRLKVSDSPYNKAYGAWYDWNEYRFTDFWNPWVTWVKSENYSVPEGFTFPGFDAYRTLHLGYSGRGLIHMNHDNQDAEQEGINHGCICKAGTIPVTGSDTTGSVSVIASWQGWHSRKQAPEGGHEKYYGDFVNATDIDADLISFKDALYASRIKIDAYAFVRSSYWKYDKGVPTKWKVYGSNDGRTWAVIDEKEKTDWTRVDTYVEFKVDNPDWYTYYKVEFLESSDGGVSLLSIDTFIEGIDEDCPYVYTTGHYYSKAWSNTDGLSMRGNADNITVTTTKGLLAKNQGVDARNYASVYQSLIQNNYGASLVAWSGAGQYSQYKDKWNYDYAFRTHSYTYQDGKVTLIIDMCKPVPVGGFKFKLNPSMDDVEIPKHIKIRGSDDNENWTELLDEDEIDWGNDYYEPLKKVFDFDEQGMYRYFEVTFFASEDALTTTYNEHWLYRMEIRNGIYGRCFTTIFKVKPDTGIYPVGGDNYMNSANNAVANFWVSDDICATITQKDIQIQKMNPITQEMALINRITPEKDNAQFLGAVMDSGKNIWYWTAKGTKRQLTGGRWDVEETGNAATEGPGLYSALNVYSSFSNETVHVEFESSNMLYEGEPLEFNAYVWVDVSHPEGTKMVSSNVSLTLSGGSAVFKDSGNDSTTITTSATEKTAVKVVASGPDRVNITATLVK